jgi:anaerobic magnesium-protoporphyrin IX monomethyl ester cyclase
MSRWYVTGAEKLPGPAPRLTAGAARPYREPMRAVLIGAEYEENLAVRYLAAALEAAGHAATIVPFSRPADLDRAVDECLRLGPDLVGLSMAFQHRAREFLELAAALRRRGYAGHVCAGGHVPTAAWRELLEQAPAVDTVVRHDGEVTLVELCGALATPARWREIPGVCARDDAGRPVAAPARRQLDDLDRLPFPVRDRPHAIHAGVPFTTISGSRGCFANCNYCCINTWHRTAQGKRYRARSAASVATEMARLYHDRAVRIFCFHDDNFFLPKPRQTSGRLGELRRETLARGVGRIAYVAKCRPDEIDLPLLEEARAMGVVRLFVGVENGSAEALRNLNRLHDLATTRRALDALRRSGVYACYNVLLFEPDTRLEHIAENLEFLAESCDFPFNFGRAEIYSGTRYERLLRAAGRLQGSFLGYTYRIADDRAEVLFRICAVAFSVRNFSADALANHNGSLGYEATLLEHFFPGDGARALVRRTRNLSERINRDTLAHLRAAYEFVRDGDWRDARGAQEFTAALATRVNLRNLELGAEVEALKAAIRGYGLQQGPAVAPSAAATQPTGGPP